MWHLFWWKLYNPRRYMECMPLQLRFVLRHLQSLHSEVFWLWNASHGASPIYVHGPSLKSWGSWVATCWTAFHLTICEEIFWRHFRSSRSESCFDVTNSHTLHTSKLQFWAVSLRKLLVARFFFRRLKVTGKLISIDHTNEKRPFVPPWICRMVASPTWAKAACGLWRPLSW